MLSQQVLRAEIADILGIANIVDIADVADIAIGITDIITDITDIITDIADRVLQTLWWKQVGVYKVSRGCPVTILKKNKKLKIYINYRQLNSITKKD